MSLFKAREWWSTQLPEDEGFSERSIAISNVDNARDGRDKIVVGSLTGLLRIFTVNSGNSTTGYQASDLLLETDLQYPILQVSSGLFLSASDKLHLAVLHPRKLSIFSVAGTAGFSEHGSSYNILLIYEHNLQRSAFNMVCGRFGQVRGRDFICVQSLDGTLAFYEQESFAFSRFLPNFLLPGPIAYIPDTDSFLVSTAAWAIESYRYQVLAIAKDGDNEKESASSASGRGRKVSPDWSIITGENILDMEVVQLEKRSTAIVVMGEKTLTVLKENGTTIFLKKFDYTPMCMHSYLNNETLMVALATEYQTVLVYDNKSLKWAAQFPFVPIAIKRATLVGIQGVLVVISASGFLSCSYLGTAPSVQIVTVNSEQNAITDYAEADNELQELKKVINAFNSDMSSFAANGIGSKSSKVNQQSDLIIITSPLTAINQQDIGARVVRKETNSESVRFLTSFTIQMEALNAISCARLCLDVAKPLCVDNAVLIFPSIAANGLTKPIPIIVSLQEEYLPPNLKLLVTVAYTNSSGAPRILQKEIQLPLYLLARIATPAKETEHTISLDVVCHASLGLKELFQDLMQTVLIPIDDEAVDSNMGIEFFGEKEEPVTVTMTTRPPQQKFRLKSDSFGGLAFVSSELIRRLQTHGVKFDTAVLDKASLPIDPYTRVIDDHLLLRAALIEKQYKLGQLGTQYRTIEKRFLVKLKDRNPTPLNDLDILLENIHSKITSVAEEIIRLSDAYKRQSNILSSATNLFAQILCIGTNMKQDQINVLRAVLSTHVNLEVDEGWEERTEVALIALLASHLKDLSDVARYSHSTLTAPSNSSKLQDLLTKLVDKIYHGDLLSVKSTIPPSTGKEATASTIASIKSNFITPSNEIIPEEDEEENSVRTQNSISKQFSIEDSAT